MMATLRIHVEQFLDEDAAHDEGGEAIADIIPVGRNTSTQGLDLNDLVIPTGPSGKVSSRRIDNVPAGEYVVRVRLPSGRALDQLITVESKDDEPVVFKTESPASEQFSWQSFVGEITEQLERTARKVRLTESGQPRAPRVSVPSFDNLQQIRGIGPAIEQELNKRGIGRIAQIANFTDLDIGWLSREVAPNRRWIDRFRWVGQAVDLLEKQGATGIDEEGPGVGQGQATADETDDMAPGAGMPDPELRFFFREEGPEPGHPTLYETLSECISANRSAAQPVAVNAQMLMANAIGPEGGMPDDLGQYGMMQSMGEISVWSLRSELPGAPSHIEKFTPLLRTYMVADDGCTQWMTSLPLPWKTLRDERPVGLDITFVRTDPAESAVSILPRHARTASFLGFIKSGDSRANQAILRNASKLLFSKILNPYAAAAGGYVLINSLRWGSDRSERSRKSGLDGAWDIWLGNLRDWNPWLPDGRILKAWHILLSQGGELEGVDMPAVRENLLKAAHAGLPVYTGVFRLLVDGLKIMKTHAGQHSEDDPEISAALRQIEMVAMRIDMRQVFTTVRITLRDRAG
jgi:predicted flap endonuclease-1-like 5' DNA nuclease